MNSYENNILLGVNIDHVATLREARGTTYPDLLEAALIAEGSGADGITVHLREDRRHIQDADVFRLKKEISTRLNLEMAVTEEMVVIAQNVQPTYCCFVPEKREELTTEGGLNVSSHKKAVAKAIERLAADGIKCSLFIDPAIDQIDSSFDVGAPIVEIHTGAYADAVTEKEREVELNRIQKAITHARDKGLQVNAGHGLTCDNVREIASMNGIVELNIGHSIVCRSLFVGLSKAVSEMKAIMVEASNN